MTWSEVNEVLLEHVGGGDVALHKTGSCFVIKAKNVIISSFSPQSTFHENTFWSCSAKIKGLVTPDLHEGGNEAFSF